MNIFIIILIILLASALILFSVLLFQKFRLKIAISKKAGEKISFSIIAETANGRFKKNLSEIGFRKKENKEKVESEKENTNLKNKIRSYYRTFEKIKYIFSNSKHKIRKKLLIEKLMFNVDFGLDDAAHTGIATGTVWSGIYNIIAFISHLSILNEPVISVNPDFENEKLAFDGECIIVLRLVNIISILNIAGKHYFDFKKQKKAAINYGNTN